MDSYSRSYIRRILLHTWDPGDVKVSLVEYCARLSSSTSWIDANLEKYHWNFCKFASVDLKELHTDCIKQIASKMEDKWVEGRPRLVNTPFEFLPVIVKNLTTESGHGLIIAS